MPKALKILLIAFALVAPVGAQRALDPNLASSIRAEAHERSQILQTLHVLTDIYGAEDWSATIRKADEDDAGDTAPSPAQAIAV